MIVLWGQYQQPERQPLALKKPVELPSQKGNINPMLSNGEGDGMVASSFATTKLVGVVGEFSLVGDLRWLTLAGFELLKLKASLSHHQ